MSRRLLQEHAKAGSGDGMSADTIAIVLSLLVGAAGYLVQVATALLHFGWRITLTRVLGACFCRPTARGGPKEPLPSKRKSCTSVSRRASVNTNNCKRKSLGQIGDFIQLLFSHAATACSCSPVVVSPIPDVLVSSVSQCCYK